MKNNRILFVSLLCLLSLAFSSCAMDRTFTVKGKPGTKIYTTTMKELATIDQSGTANVTIEASLSYRSLLLAKGPDDALCTPFALDFDALPESTVRLKQLATWGGEVLGLVGLCAGIPLMVTTSPVAGGILTAAGIGGVASMVWGVTKGGSLAGDPSETFRFYFDYHPEQNANTDLNMGSRTRYEDAVAQRHKSPKEPIVVIPAPSTTTDLPPVTTPAKDNSLRYYTNGQQVVIVSLDGDKLLLCSSPKADAVAALQHNKNFFSNLFKKYTEGSLNEKQRQMVTLLNRDPKNPDRYTATVSTQFLNSQTTCSFSGKGSTLLYEVKSSSDFDDEANANTSLNLRHIILEDLLK